MRDRTIVLVGGGFSDDEFVDLDDFLIDSPGVARPRVCFVPTASGDSPDYISRFYRAFEGRDCEPTHLELFNRTVDDLDEFLARQDVIYVGGGNTANLLAVWRLHGVDAAIGRAYHTGVVLGGISAGAACWFEACLTDSFGPLSPLNDGLGFLSGSFCPHYNTDPERPASFRSAIDSSALPCGVALDDGAAAKYVNGNLQQIYRSDQNSDLHILERSH